MRIHISWVPFGWIEKRGSDRTNLYFSGRKQQVVFFLVQSSTIPTGGIGGYHFYLTVGKVEYNIFPLLLAQHIPLVQLNSGEEIKLLVDHRSAI